MKKNYLSHITRKKPNAQMCVMYLILLEEHCYLKNIYYITAVNDIDIFNKSVKNNGTGPKSRMLLKK